MSRKMLTVAALAIMALPLTTAQGQLSFGIGAGLSAPSGDLKDGVESGYHVMGIVGIAPPLSPVGFRVDGTFNEFNSKGATDTKLRIMSLTGNAVLSMPGAIVLSPYAIGGLGMYNSKSTDPADDESDNDLGVNIGAGIKFGLAGFGAFAEVRFHHLFIEEPAVGSTPKIRFIPITFGITF